MNPIARYFSDLRRAFVLGGGGGQTQSVYYSGDESTFTPSKYGDYVATSSDIYIASNYRAKTLSSVPLKLYKGTKKTEVTSGTLYEILQKVNPYWTARRLFQMSELSLCLWGSAYWFMDRGGKGGEPREIWWARPDKVKVVSHPTNYISHFEYDIGSGQVMKFSREETLWLRYPNPIDEYAGLSPLAAARIAADTSTNAMRSNAKMFENGMQVAGVVSPKIGEQWTDQQALDISESIQRRLVGPNRAHRWVVLKRETQFQPLSISAKDAEYIAALNWSFETVCRVYGLSPDLLGGKTTFSNSAEARMALWEDTMKPECSFFADEITEQLLPLFPGQADIAEFDLTTVGVLQEAELSKWSRWKEQIEKGAKTVNEYRVSIGDDPLLWGDDWYSPSSLVPIGGPMAAEAEKKALAAADAMAAQLEQQAAPPTDPNNPPAELPMPPAKGAKALASGQTRALEFGGTEHQRLWDARVKQVDPLEATFGQVTARLMRDQQKSILAKLTKREAMPDYSDFVDEPFDKPRWVKRFREDSRPVIREIVKEAGVAALVDLKLSGAFDVFNPLVARFIEQRAQRFAVQVNDTTWEALRSSLSEGLQAGESIDDLAKRVDSVMADRIRSSATVIARTEVNGATNAGAMLAAEQSGVVQGKTWVAALGDERTRETHIAAHDQTVKLAEDFQVGAGAGPSPGQIGIAAEDVNCFPADTVVYAENIHAAMMRAYVGAMVTITLHDRVVTVTPNHPLLTDTGWKIAGDIAEGDDLIGYSLVDNAVPPGPDPYEAPSEISKIFSLALMAGHSRRVPGGRPQFHGDGSSGDVDIVWPHSQLLNAGNPTIFDPSRQQILTASNIKPADLFGHSTGGEFSVAASLTPDGIVRGGGKSLSFIGAGLGHAEVHGFTSVALNDPVSVQGVVDRGSARTEVASKRLYRHPGVVTVNKVVGVNVVSFHGPVYNLHTESNHYTANGIISQNCRCFLNFVLDVQEMPA